MSAPPLRVLRVLARPNLGGPARQLRALSRHLPGLGVRELRVHGPVPRGEAELGLGPGAPVDPRTAELCGPRAEGDVLLPGLGPAEGAGTALTAVTGLLRLIRSFAPQVVHTHTAKAGFVGAVAGRLAGVPVLHSFHGHVLRDHFGPTAGRLLRVVERGLAPLRAGFHVVGESCAAELATLGVVDRERCAVIPPLLDLALLDAGTSRDEARARLGIPATERAVAWIGRLVPVKDPGLAVDAFARFAARKDARLHVFGTGPLEAELRAAAAGLPVRLHGSRPELPALLAAFDVVLSSSRREGLPLAVLEALVAGVPVVAPRVPGLVDLEGAGLRLVPREPGALAAGLAEPWPVPAERRQELRRRHDPARLAASYVDLYRKLLPAGSGMGDPLRPAFA